MAESRCSDLELCDNDTSSRDSISPLRRKLEQQITCSICHDHFNDPRSLSCGHGFCLRCLKRLLMKDNSISCPLCRAVHSDITALDTLPQSSAINSTFEVYNLVKKIPDGDKGRAPCDNCSKLPPSNAANICCMQCNMFLCHDCLQQHNNWKPYVAHKALSLEEMIEAVDQVIPEKMNQMVQRCYRHGKSLDVFCETCEELVCQSCANAGRHIGHKTNDFGNEFHLIDMKTSRLEQSLKMLKHRKNEIAGQAGLVREEIQYTVAEIRAALEKEEKKLLGQVDQTLIYKNEVLDHQIKEVESNLRELEKHRNGLAQLARLSTLHEFKATKSTFVGKLKEMIDRREYFEPLEEADFKLERNDDMRQILCRPIIGKVSCSSFVTTVKVELKKDNEDSAGVSKEYLDFTMDSKHNHTVIPMSLIDCYAFGAKGHRYSIPCVPSTRSIGYRSHQFDITIPVQCKKSQIYVEICGVDTLNQHELYYF